MYTPFLSLFFLALSCSSSLSDPEPSAYQSFAEKVNEPLGPTPTRLIEPPGARTIPGRFYDGEPPLTPVALLLSQKEAATLRAGTVQIGEVLGLLFKDLLYGDQRVIRDGLLSRDEAQKLLPANLNSIEEARSFFQTHDPNLINFSFQLSFLKLVLNKSESES